MYIEKCGNFNQLCCRNQKGSLLLILGFVVILIIIAGGYFLGTQKKTPMQNNDSAAGYVFDNTAKVPKKTPSPSNKVNTTFQKLLIENCKPDPKNIQTLSGKIALESLPITIKIAELKNTQGFCDTNFSRYVNIYGNEIGSMTISDKNSYYCCHAPSSIVPTGKLIKSSGDINIYIHTGTWNEGPNSGYKAITVRGVRNIELKNGEEIRVVLDREAITEENTDLQKIEDKYKIIDPFYESGKKILTPESVEKMLEDGFFANIGDSQIAKKVETDLQSISLK